MLEQADAWLDEQRKAQYKARLETGDEAEEDEDLEDDDLDEDDNDTDYETLI